MPRRALKPCAHPGCPSLVSSGRCGQHRRRRVRLDSRADARARGTARQRGYDRDWEKVRRIKMAKDPLCERCAEHGRTTPAKLVHHVVPVKVDPSLRLVVSNLRSLCVPCHPIEELEAQGVSL